MPDSFDYTTGTNSENVRLLQALIDDAPEYTEETNSRNANILKSIINNTEYTDAPQSEIEELLLRLKAKIGGEIEVDELNVTENGTYNAGVNKAYNPVTVELPLSSKTITENGTYTASDDNLAGFNEVTVAVEGYAKKSISNTPTPIATFNASALPMPSLKVGIEAVQAGTGDPSPTNIRPITGWSAVNVYRTGKNLFFHTIGSGSYRGITYTFNSDGTFETGDTSTNTINLTLGTIVLPAGTYFLSGCPSGGGLRAYGLQAVDNPITTSYGQDFGDGVEFTLTKKTSISIRLQVGASGVNMDNLTFKPMLTLSSQKPDDFVPCNGQVYTTPLKDGQGNPLVCYGGELSNQNGVQSLDNTYGELDLGAYNWNYSGVRFVTTGQIADMKAPVNNFQVANVMCSIYKTATSSETESGANDAIIGISRYRNICIRDSRYTDATAFKEAMSGIKLVYELATPQTIPQDNLAISSQDGTNNIWADSGDVLEGSYFKEL